MSRPIQLNIRLSDEEARILRGVAEFRGLSVSDVVRQAFRAEYASEFRKVRNFLKESRLRSRR